MKIWQTRSRQIEARAQAARELYVRRYFYERRG